MTLATVAPKARPYQVEARERVNTAWSEGLDGPAPLLVMATGTGKTVTGLMIAEQIRGRVVWLAHREELLTQPLAALWYDQQRAGIVQADRDAVDARIVFGSFATLDQPDRRHALLRHGYPDLIVVDEAHHSVSPSHRRVIESLRGPETRLLGLTATADREDDADLGELWRIVYTLGIVEAVDQGYLLPPFAAVARCPGLDLARVSGRRDYDDAALAAALLAAHIVEHTVAAMGGEYVATRLPRRDERRTLRPRGRSCLVFTATVDQAERTAAGLRAEGWRAAVVHGGMVRAERRGLLRRFTAGELDVLCNAAVLTEGTDLPVCDCVVIARPTRSWALYCQQVGRGLRLHGDQTECLVLDLVGSTEDHSLVAAPVLVGVERCKAPGGRHSWVEDGYRAVCAVEGCRARLPCWAALQAGRQDGAHKWDDSTGYRRCVYCSQPQCPGGPAGRHTWVPQPGLKLECIDCEAAIPMQLASMQGDRVGSDAPEPAAWTALHSLGRVEVVPIEGQGLLYLVGEAGDTWSPVWLPDGGRVGRPLSAAPVDRWHAEALAADLVRRARKGWDPYRAEVLHGGVPVAQVGDLRRRAIVRAVSCGIARVGGSGG